MVDPALGFGTDELIFNSYEQYIYDDYHYYFYYDFFTRELPAEHHVEAGAGDDP